MEGCKEGPSEELLVVVVAFEVGFTWSVNGGSVGGVVAVRVRCKGNALALTMEEGLMPGISVGVITVTCVLRSGCTVEGKYAAVAAGSHDAASADLVNLSCGLNDMLSCTALHDTATLGSPEDIPPSGGNEGTDE